MGIAQSGNQSNYPIATVNRKSCCTDAELQKSLRKAVSRRRGPVEIAIHDPAAQRTFLSLALYSPEELLPQSVGSVVGDMRHSFTHNRKPMDRKSTKNLELYLAMTEMMNHSPSSTARLVGSAVLSAIGLDYDKFSFGTTHQDEQTGAVLISMKA